MRSLVLTLTFLSVVSGELFAQRIPEGTLVCRSRSALELYVSGDSSSIGECERVASESEITVMFDHGDVAMIRVYGMALYTWVQAAAIAGS